MTPHRTNNQPKLGAKILKCLRRSALVVLLPLLVTVIPVLLTFYLTKNHDLELKITQDKITRYENLITYINRGFLNSNLSDSEKAQNKRMYYEQTYVVWLYAPDSVINALNQFAFAFSAWDTKKSPHLEDKVKQAMAVLVLAMRKDVHKKTCLTESDFVTTIVQ